MKAKFESKGAVSSEPKRSFRPIDGNIVVKYINPEDVSKGGIVLPDSMLKKPTKGEVVAVGPGRISAQGERIKMQVEIGAVVMFPKHAGQPLKYDGNDFQIMTENDLLLVLE